MLREVYFCRCFFGQTHMMWWSELKIHIENLFLLFLPVDSGVMGGEVQEQAS